MESLISISVYMPFIIIFCLDDVWQTLIFGRPLREIYPD